MANNYKNCCVINSAGYYQTNVLVHLEPGEDGGTVERIDTYILKSGEALIEASVPSNMIGPRWNGTTWEETGIRVITLEEVEQLRNSKLQQIGAACTATIYAGVSVKIGKETKHFSLEQHDQTELMGLKPQLDAMVAAGDMSTPSIPYHADGELCRLWTAADFAMILTAATEYIFYHRTYCNHILTWTRREDNYDALEAISYGAPLPEDLNTHMQALLAAGEGVQEE